MYMYIRTYTDICGKFFRLKYYQASSSFCSPTSLFPTLFGGSPAFSAFFQGTCVSMCVCCARVRACVFACVRMCVCMGVRVYVSVCLCVCLCVSNVSISVIVTLDVDDILGCGYIHTSTH